MPSLLSHAHKRIALTAALLMLLAGTSQAQVYKCLKDGVTTYQEMPCDGNGATLDIPLSTPHQSPPEEPAAESGEGEPVDAAQPGKQSLSQQDIDRIADAVEQRRLDAEPEEIPFEDDLQEEQPISSCRGIRIYSAVAYDVGGQTYLQRWRHDSRFRRRFVDIARTQCASIVVKLPGYYGDIFSSMEDTFARRFVATFADDTIRAGESVELPEGRVDHTAKYRIRVCFGEGDFPIISVDCE
jgi:hypothetical protein